MGRNTTFFKHGFSMTLSYFYTTHKQRHSLPLFWTIFSRKFLQKAASEDKAFPPEQRTSMLTVHCKGFAFPKLRVTLLSCKPWQVQVSPGPICSKTLWELRLRELPQENSDTLSTAISLINKVLFL